jgi:hypothetical protein
MVQTPVIIQSPAFEVSGGHLHEYVRNGVSALIFDRRSAQPIIF